MLMKEDEDDVAMEIWVVITGPLVVHVAERGTGSDGTSQNKPAAVAPVSSAPEHLLNTIFSSAGCWSGAVAMAADCSSHHLCTS